MTNIKAGDDLLAAINDARPGDTLSIEANATFEGNFILPAKGDGAPITIESSAIRSLTPGQRVTPADAAQMPKLVSTNSNGTITTAARARNWILRGLEITMRDDVSLQWDTVVIGQGEKTVEDLPGNIVIDRCYIHAHEQTNAKRGIRMNGHDLSVTNCYISEFHCDFNDSQGICCWNGTGPLLIENNYIEGSAENIMIGGDVPTIPGLIPTGIVVRGNHMFKQMKWREGEPGFVGRNWYVKNTFELKNASDVLVEGNILENCWVKMQAGGAFLLNGVDQPGSVIRRVKIQNNIVINHQSLFMAGGNDRYSNPAPADLEFSNNLFYDQRSDPGASQRIFQFVTDIPNLKLLHNTCINSGDLCYAGEANPPTHDTHLVIDGNIWNGGGAGWMAIGRGMPDAITDYWPGAKWTNNITLGVPAAKYPPGEGNLYPPNWESVGFVDAGAKDFRMKPGSVTEKYGVDFAKLEAATKNTRSGKGAVPPMTQPPVIVSALPGTTGTDGKAVTINANTHALLEQFARMGNISPDKLSNMILASWVAETAVTANRKILDDLQQTMGRIVLE